MKKNKGKTLCIIIYVLTVIVGAAGGYLLYRFAGCGAGSCSVTLSRRRTRSNLWLSARYTSLPTEKSRRIKAVPTAK